MSREQLTKEKGFFSVFTSVTDHRYCPVLFSSVIRVECVSQLPISAASAKLKRGCLEDVDKTLVMVFHEWES